MLAEQARNPVHAYRFLIHDRDSIFSKKLDEDVTAMGVRVLRTPIRASKANSTCEHFGGTLRHECLDFLIPFSERHLRLVVKTLRITTTRGRI